MSISLNKGLQMGGDNSGWWGGTHGRMSRRMRVDECDVLLPIEGFRPWLMENGARAESDVAIVVAALRTWAADTASFELMLDRRERA